MRRHATDNLTISERLAMDKMTERDHNQAISAALKNMEPDQQEIIKRLADQIMTEIQMKRGKAATGIGITSAYELLAHIGMWLVVNPRAVYKILPDADDLDPARR